MKGILDKIGKKLAQTANDIATYNGDPLSGIARPKPVAGEHDNYEQSDPVIEHLLRNVRSKHVRQQFFKTPASTYTSKKDIRVLAGTYNVNGKKPAAGTDLAQWLGLWSGEWPADANGDTKQPDIIAVGFQEIVPLNAGNVIVGSTAANLEGWDRATGSYLNGEPWAQHHYGAPNLDGSSPAQAGQVLGALNNQWEGAATDPTTNNNNRHGGPEGAWVQIAARQMVGIYLSIWIRRSLLMHVRGVQATHTATGFGGWAGNKGAVVVRMRVYDSPLVFVCSHLSAGEMDGDELKRNGDVSEILRRTDFTACGDGPGSMAAPTAALISSTLGIGHWGTLNGVTDHGSAIWVGDLNYRLQQSVLSDEDARKALRAGQLAPLLDADQLIREMMAGRVFTNGWREGPITFMPTFKFKVGTNTYLGEPGTEGAEQGGTDPEELAPVEAGKQKKRTPAWCDRILWLNTHGCLHQLNYKRSELTASDHKPVAAAFLMQARSYDRSKVDTLLQEARRTVDMMAAMQRPKCSLEPKEVVVPDVLGHAVVYRHTVTIANKGNVEGMWHFVPPPSGLGQLVDDGPALPAWLTAIPAEGVVPPGEQCEVTLEVCVEGGPHGAAAQLRQAAVSGKGTKAAGKPGWEVPFDAIVILRVEDGGDMFLCVNGKARVGFLGVPLPALLESPQPGAFLPPITQATILDLIKQGCQNLPQLTQLLNLPLHAQQVNITQYLPAPWAALLAGVLATQSLGTAAGLFSHSAEHVLLKSGATVPATSDQAIWSDKASVRTLLQHLSALSDSVQAGSLEKLAAADPHSLAALLGAALLELPTPLLPTQLSELCTTYMQEPGLLLADKVLASFLRAPEAALLCAVRGLMHRLFPAPLPKPASEELSAALAILLMGPLHSHDGGPEVVARRNGLAAHLLLPQPSSA